MFEIQQIIHLVIIFCNAITRAFYFVYILSVMIGQRLAECIVFAVKCLWNIAEASATVLKIIYEDYIFFLQDVAHKITRIVSILWNAADGVVSLFINSCNSLKNFTFWMQNTLISYLSAMLGMLEKMYNILGRIPDMLKHAIVLIGTSCYLALQIIPVAIVYVLSMIVFMVGRSFEEILCIIGFIKIGITSLSTGILKFFMELPPEAVIGLACGCFVCYMSVKYFSLITEVVKQVVLFCRTQILQGFTCLWVKLEMFLLWICTNNSPDVPAAVEEDETIPYISEPPHPTVSKCQEESGYSDLCVVCQDRQKCVIIFPCRHLCLCRECCGGVQQASGRCPLCRRAVNRTMKVYV